jgi:hypothetical protein
MKLQSGDGRSSPTTEIYRVSSKKTAEMSLKCGSLGWLKVIGIEPADFAILQIANRSATFLLRTGNATNDSRIVDSGPVG